ncbi:MAG: queuosine precursor transporter [Parcubacteria group bacterium]|nr:queuosine precursor transporter [Parcubacteria group bacterium]
MGTHIGGARAPLIEDPSIAAAHPTKFLSILGMVWVSFLLLLTFTQLKTFALGDIIFSVGVITYPLTYIFADIFTEVYGYSVSRRIVWTGFFCILLISCIAYVYSIVPSSEGFADDAAFNLIFRASPLIAIATILGFFGGELMNSYVLAKMKVYMRGSRLWIRLIGSTLAGQFVDNGTFFVLGAVLAGIFRPEDVPSLILTSVAFCTTWETIMLPITYRVIAYLKCMEGLDTYDRGTDFNPFRLHIG